MTTLDAWILEAGPVGTLSMVRAGVVVTGLEWARLSPTAQLYLETAADAVRKEHAIADAFARTPVGLRCLEAEANGKSIAELAEEDLADAHHSAIVAGVMPRSGA